jgi:hypothetical protein
MQVRQIKWRSQEIKRAQKSENFSNEKMACGIEKRNGKVKVRKMET